MADDGFHQCGVLLGALALETTFRTAARLPDAAMIVVLNTLVSLMVAEVST